MMRTQRSLDGTGEETHEYRWLLPMASLALLLCAPWLGLSSFWIRQIILILTLSLVVSGLNLSFGYAGELALGQVGYYAMGAYVTAYLAAHTSLGLISILVIAAAATTVVGVLAGLPGLRLGGWALAVTSLFFILLIPDIAILLPGATGGYIGMFGISVAHVVWLQLTPRVFYCTVVLIAGGWYFCFRNLVLSRHGVAFKTLRESPVLTVALGMSTMRLKLSAYAIGAAPAGVAGGLFALANTFISPGSFTFDTAVAVLAASVIGGSASIYGALFGSTLLVLGPLQASSFQSYSPIIYGAALVACGVLFAGGAAGAFHNLRATVQTKIAKRRAALGSPSSRDDDEESSTRLSSLGWTFKGEMLSVTEVNKSFGGNRVLRGLSVAFEPGTIVAITGPNGSGKTTLLNLISGYYRFDSGDIKLGDLDISGSKAFRISRLGIRRTFQAPRIAAGLTVQESVIAGRYATSPRSMGSAMLRTPRYRATRADDLSESAHVLDWVGLRHVASADALSLSTGSRRLVELARAVVCRPTILLLDEPASGLDEKELDTLGRLLQELAGAGCTVLLVEHNLAFVRNVADRVVSMEEGVIVRDLDTANPLLQGLRTEISIPDEITDQGDTEIHVDGSADETVVAHLAAPDEPVTAPAIDPIVNVSQIAVARTGIEVVHDVSLSLYPGRIVAMLGENGAGKTTTIRAIAGLCPHRSGRIEFKGSDLSGMQPYDRARLGIATVAEGRQIFLRRTVEENLLLGGVCRAQSKRAAHEATAEVYDIFPVLSGRRRARAGELSGGQQQMLALGQALVSRPEALLLDEPSFGLAPIILEELFETVRRLASERNIAVLLVEQVIDQVLDLADEVVVLNLGRTVFSTEREEGFDAGAIRTAYVGATEEHQRAEDLAVEGLVGVIEESFIEESL
jgi:branched-chain amino acid transport system permease protein